LIGGMTASLLLTVIVVPARYYLVYLNKSAHNAIGGGHSAVNALNPS